MQKFYTKHFRLFLTASLLVIVGALVMQLCGVGLNLGIDFTGGSILEYSVGESYDVADVETILSATGCGDAQITKTAPSAASEALQSGISESAVSGFTGGMLSLDKSAIPDDGLTDLQIRLRLGGEASDQLRASLEREMTAKYPGFRFVSIDHVSAIAGADLLGNALKALLAAFGGMLIYIALRFDMRSGLAALIALVHDVLIMMSFMVFFRAFFQVNSPFIAAVLTIIGYSINNTIIIFDRIRENAKLPRYSDKSKMEIVELSVSSTIGRTVNTTLTTLITLVALYAFGVEAIREFAFPLIVGMLAGTYSSVLLSGQVWAMMHRAKEA